MRSCPTVGGSDLTSPGPQQSPPKWWGMGGGPPASIHPKGLPGSRLAQSGDSVAGGALQGDLRKSWSPFDGSRSSILLCYLNPRGCSWGPGLLPGSLTRPAMNPGSRLCSVPLVSPVYVRLYWHRCPLESVSPSGSSPCALLRLSARILPIPAHPQRSPCLPISISLGATSLYLSPWIC